jgi:hypothetical protein
MKREISGQNTGIDADADDPLLVVDNEELAPASLVPSHLVQESDDETLEEPSPADAAVHQESAFPRRSIRAKLGVGLRRTAHYTIVAPARLACLIALLGILSVVPILQLAVLGYLLEISARIARGGRFQDSLILLPQAGRIGMAVLAVYLWTLPIQLLAYYAYVAELIEPGNPRGASLRIGATAVALIALVHLTWAWVRGGSLKNYLWPQPLRFFRQAWRPSLWSNASDDLWRFLKSLRIPSLIWLGLRAAIGTIAWILLPALMLIGAIRNGETGLAGLVGAIGLLAMGFVVMYLPMLQVQFATDNRIRSIFAWRSVRHSFRAAPIAVWLGTACTLLLAIPLYLLKIEATPKEVVWLTSIVFIAFMLPAHLVIGWAQRRAINREPGGRLWHRGIRWTFRLLTLPVVFTYLFFVYLSQLTSWDGLATWIQQHAFLVPVPFVGV